MTFIAPDPLQRFVPTEHHISLPSAAGGLQIQSNDARLLGDVAALLDDHSPHLTHIRLIVDHHVSNNGGKITLIDCGPVRTILRGTTTILMYDAEIRELLAFLTPQLSAEDLVFHLLPLCCARDDDKGVTTAVSLRDNS